jgi:hypothetical protein
MMKYNKALQPTVKTLRVLPSAELSRYRQKGTLANS